MVLQGKYVDADFYKPTDRDYYKIKFETKREFEQIMVKIANDVNMRHPSVIYSEKAENKLPKYIRLWILTHHLEYHQGEPYAKWPWDFWRGTWDEWK